MKTFIQIRSQLRAQKNLLNAIADFRIYEDVDTILAYGGEISTSPQYRSIVGRAPFPRKHEELASKPFPFRVELEKAVAWRVSVLSAHSEKLNSYLSRRQTLERAQLFGTMDEQMLELAAAETEFGKSMWLLDGQLNHASATGDNAKRNKLASAVSSSKETPAIVRNLISWAAYRGAARISVSEVDNLISERAGSDTSIGCLTHYLLGRTPPLNEELAIQILYLIDNLSVVDQYNFLLTTLLGLHTSQELSEQMRQALLPLLEFLFETISDPALHRLLICYGKHPAPTSKLEKVSDLLDAYTEGRYEDVLSIADMEGSDLCSIEAINVCIRAAAALDTKWQLPAVWAGGDCLANTIVLDLIDVASFAEEGVAARLRLEKIALAYSGTTWASSLALVLHRQREDERVVEPSAYAKFHGLLASVEQPMFAFLLNEHCGVIYLKNCVKNQFAPVTASALLSILVDAKEANKSTIPDERLRRLTASKALRQQDHETAAAILTAGAGQTINAMVDGESALLLVQIYLAQQRLSEAISLAGRLIVRSTYFGLVLPIRLLVKLIMLQHDSPMSSQGSVRGQIGVAIVLDIYSRQIAADRDAERADSFQDVLQRYEVKRASELPQVKGTLSMAELSYFLRFVCVPGVLDQSLALRSTKEVEDERAAILAALGSMLTSNGRAVPAAVKEELSEISTRQVVRDTARRLDQSKVYVNVEGIRRSIDVTMRESWNRYRLSQLQDPGDEDLDLLRKIVEGALGTTVTVARVGAPLSQSDQIFRLMTLELRDQFATNKEFGLNANLSTNIRHGYVLRELRGPFAARNLITNRDSESGTYQLNSYWHERVREDLAGPLQEILDRFSHSIDNEVEHINRDLLRIRSESIPKGLFVYDLDETEVRKLESDLEKIDSYDDFVNAIFDFLWSLTERNLKRVRAILLEQELMEFGRLISQLEADLAESGLNIEVPALNHAITSVRQDFRDALARVAGWFTLSRVQEYEDFDLQIAYQAGLQSVRKYYANLNIDASCEEVGAFKLQGWCLPVLARLFFLLLDNAASHGAGNRDNLKLRVILEWGKDNLFLKVTNDLDPTHDMERTGQIVAALNSDYGQEKAADLVGEEGGSGYPKIWKLLSFDLRTNHDLFVSVVDNQFSVEILMSSRGLLA